MDADDDPKKAADRSPTAPPLTSSTPGRIASTTSFVYPVRSLLSNIQTADDPEPPQPAPLPTMLSSDNVEQFTTDIRGKGPSKTSRVKSWSKGVTDAGPKSTTRRGSFSGQDDGSAPQHTGQQDFKHIERSSRSKSTTGTPGRDIPRSSKTQTRDEDRIPPSFPLTTPDTDTSPESQFNTLPTTSLNDDDCPSSATSNMIGESSSGPDTLSGSASSHGYVTADEFEPFNLAQLGLVHLPPLASPDEPKSSRTGMSPLVTPLAAEPVLSHLSPTSSRSSSPVTSPPKGMEVTPIEVSETVPDASSSNIEAAGDDAPVATFRFEYRENEDGHHVIVGREGKIMRCEDEPIRTPGSVQGFGVLIVVDEDEEKQTLLNCEEILGFTPNYLFSLECFTEILDDHQVDHLWDNIQFLNEPEYNAEEEEDSPHVFLLSGWGQPGSASDNDGDDEGRRSWTCWCAVHRPPAPAEGPQRGPNLIIMEFELERDTINPLYPTLMTAQHGSTSSPMSTGSGSSNNASSNGSAGSDSTLVTGSRGSGEGENSSATGSMSTLIPSPASASPRDSVSPRDADIANGDSASIASAGLVGQPWVSSTPASLRGLDGEDDWAPSPEDILESTTSYSKPLSALERLRRMSRASTSPSADSSPTRARRGSRRRRAGNTGTTGVGMMDVFAVMAQINEQLGAATKLDEFLKITAGVIKDLTQFHRVLVYQFDEMWNGQVVAELVDWSQTHDLYRGLHFPASDIPAQARELYAINKVRLLYDRSQAPARIIARSKKDLEHPLNMTHCFIRAMSPIHIKYLGNMGVRASMSVSIMAFGTLWGLVACHSYGENGMRVSFPVRQMLRLLSQSISRNIERLSYAQRLHTRKLINTVTSDNHPTGYIVSTADDLLGLFDADYGILVIGEGAKILGPNLHGQEILIMAEYLRLKRFNNIQASQAVSVDYPDLRLSMGFELIAGLLYVPLSQGGRDFIAFLRKGQPREVHWAGKPSKDGVGTEGRLEPRKSFKIWSETVAGRCRMWTDEQLETAGVLALVYGKFIEVWRQKETALQTTKLTNLLLSNASHEVRTPLNHIINYLEMALSGSLDGETRENLSRSHAASKSLLFTINDLLDLTRLESGNETSFNEPFNLHHTIQDATQVYRNEAERRDINFTVDVSQSPSIAIGDSKKIRTVVQNLTANALKYTSKGSISVCCMTFGEPDGLREPSQTAVEIVVADTGCGIPPAKLESIFREFEQVESSSLDSEPSSAAGVGLGLAVVARIVEQLGGQLRVDSKVNQGSRFSFLIPLALSLNGDCDVLSSRSPSATGSNNSQSSVRSVSFVNQLHARRQSQGSSAGAGSEVDSFVEAISSSHMNSPGLQANRQISITSSPRSLAPGLVGVSGSNTPLRPVKVDGYDMDTRIPTPSERAERPERIENVNVNPRLLLPRDVDRDYTRLRVLVVEDNDINRTILAKRLRMDGHTVVNTTNGQEGLDMVKSDREFDCVLMDIQMPILNGFQASEQIRVFEKRIRSTSERLSLELNGRIPIFAVSASLEEQQRSELWSYGIDGWILKPIDFKRLREILRGVTNPRQREKDMYRPGCNWEDGGWLRQPNSEEASPANRNR